MSFSFNLPYMPDPQALLPAEPFEQLIGNLGQRTSWLRGRTCPCVYGSAGPQSLLQTPGSPSKSCQTCFGVGTFWTDPSPIFRALLTYSTLTASQNEPGTQMDETYGLFYRASPNITIPKYNPYLSPADPGQPTNVWLNASDRDIFCMVDMTSRYVAVLQNGGQIVLPYQQNLSIAITGAVSIWNPITQTLVSVSGYAVSGASVTLPSGYAPGQNFMVEFTACPLYVVFRSSGGFPRIRPLGGGSLAEPKKFQLQTLDWWTRWRIGQPTVQDVALPQTQVVPFATMMSAPS